MEEHEVDLRDHIRVLWWGKWIIALLFAGAVGLALIVSITRPEVYRAEVVLAIPDTTAILPTHVPPTPEKLSERARDAALLARIADGPMTATWLSQHTRATKRSAFVDLAVEGVRPPQALIAAAERIVSALQAEASAMLAEAIAVQLARLQLQQDVITSRLAAWLRDLEEARTATEATWSELREAIAAIAADPAATRLDLGSQVTVEGYLVQKELDLLYARLQDVESSLDEMERGGVAFIVGAEQEAALRSELAAVEIEVLQLRSVEVTPDSSILILRGPTLAGPLRPSLKLILAVAAILGLFAGAVVTFFIHWLREGRATTGDSLEGRR